MTPHLEADKGAYADIVLLPGDPLRAKWLADNFLDDVGHNREQIDTIDKILTCLNGCDIRINYNREDSLFLHCLHGLGARIIELAGLANLQCARSEDEYPFGFVRQFQFLHPLAARRKRQKIIKQKPGVLRPG